MTLGIVKTLKLVLTRVKIRVCLERKYFGYRNVVLGFAVGGEGDFQHNCKNTRAVPRTAHRAQPF